MRGIHPSRLTSLRQARRAGTIPAQIGMTAMAGVALIAATRTVVAGNPSGLLAAGLAFLLVCAVVADRMRQGYPHDRIGGCNVVTLMRAGLVCALLMPLLRFISPTDPRWVSTMEAVKKDLVEDSLVRRSREARRGARAGPRARRR